MSLTPDDIERRIRAKRFNERLKLSATTLNTIGLTLFGTSIVVPLAGGVLSAYSLIWIPVAAGLHYGSHFVLGRLISED